MISKKKIHDKNLESGEKSILSQGWKHFANAVIESDDDTRAHMVYVDSETDTCEMTEMETILESMESGALRKLGDETLIEETEEERKRRATDFKKLKSVAMAYKRLKTDVKRAMRDYDGDCIPSSIMFTVAIMVSWITLLIVDPRVGLELEKLYELSPIIASVTISVVVSYVLEIILVNAYNVYLIKSKSRLLRGILIIRILGIGTGFAIAATTTGTSLIEAICYVVAAIVLDLIAMFEIFWLIARYMRIRRSDEELLIDMP
jgi:hypothetical protein